MYAGSVLYGIGIAGFILTFDSKLLRSGLEPTIPKQLWRNPAVVFAVLLCLAVPIGVAGIIGVITTERRSQSGVRLTREAQP